MKAAKFFVFGFLRGLRDGPEQDKRCARQKYKDGFQKTFGQVHAKVHLLGLVDMVNSDANFHVSFKKPRH